MTKDQNVGADGDGCFPDGLNAINRLIESDSGPGADGPFCRQSHVRDQQIRARLSEDQELMVRLTRDIVTHDVDTDSFFTQTASFAPARPELTQVIWLNADRTPRATFLGSIFRGAASLRNSAEDPSLPHQGASTASEAAFEKLPWIFH